MKLRQYDGIAIVPRRCHMCNRLFWMQPYDYVYKQIGLGVVPIIDKRTRCVQCKKERRTSATDN